jgi:hypothetical protein
MREQVTGETTAISCLWQGSISHRVWLDKRKPIRCHAIAMLRSTSPLATLLSKLPDGTGLQHFCEDVDTKDAELTCGSACQGGQNFRLRMAAFDIERRLRRARVVRKDALCNKPIFNIRNFPRRPGLACADVQIVVDYAAQRPF